MKTITACTLDCPDGCSLVVETGADGSVRIEGNPDHPFTAGFICEKMRHFGRRLRHPDRITRPLLRAGGGWQPIDWEEALDLCAQKIQTYRREQASILHVRGGGDQAVVCRVTDLFFARLGASRAGGSLCNSAGTAACTADFGSVDHNDVPDLLTARRIVNWGRDPLRSSVHGAALLRQARQRGAQVLTISPSGADARALSDVWIPIRPGTDRFLAAAVLRLLVERGRAAPDLSDCTSDWPAFRELLLSRSLDELSAACDVPFADMERVYACYAGPEPAATVIGWGLQRYDYGGENVRFINALALVSGNIGRSGGGSYYTHSSVRSYNLDWATGPAQRTLLKPTIGRDILQAQDPPIKMIWVNATNLVNQAPDCHETLRAFAATEFKVVVDAFLNDTAARADLILPCALTLEREDLAGGVLHNFVNYAARAVEPPGEARTDHWIVSELGKRLDPPVLVPTVEEILRASLDSPFVDASLDELRRTGYAPAKRPAIAYADRRFPHPDGKYHFPARLHDETPSPPGYPFRLLTLVRREVIHSQILPEDHEPFPTVWVAPDSVALHGLDLARDVDLVSPLGRLKVKVKTLSGLYPEAVLCRRGGWMSRSSGFNQLVADGATDLGGGTAFYHQYVRLENG